MARAISLQVFGYFTQELFGHVFMSLTHSVLHKLKMEVFALQTDIIMPAVNI